MKLLLFSDLHRDVGATRALVTRAPEVDVLVGAGDFAVTRRGIDDVIEVLRTIDTPTVLVPGNAESDQELRRACQGWSAARILHGESTEIDGVLFFGLGGGVPVTPFGDWSFDLSEAAAEELLSECPEGAVLVSHSPPHGHVDQSRGQHLGSRAVFEAIQRCRPPLVVCGHIHESQGQWSRVGETAILNAGPTGTLFELP